jgi:bifunctional UDP-N-acetylglucosamine pyrophosphorylase / glucosamine-1-phosphate N-acetyltransferase
MKSATPKVLHRIGGRSLLAHAMVAARGVSPERLVVVVRHGRDRVADEVKTVDPDALVVDQDDVPGTGRAVQVALEALPDLAGTVLVTYGDVPLLGAEALSGVLADHAGSGAAVTVVTAFVDDPTGYGRIVRGPDGSVERIVEHRDADAGLRAVREINSGIYAFDGDLLRSALGRVTRDNVQGEMYLTDVVAVARAEGRAVAGHVLGDVWQTEGVNDRAQLARLGAELNRRVLERWMRDGVTIVDPATTWVDVDVDLATDVTILPGTQLLGATVVAEGATIGPDTTLTDVEVGAGASVVRTHGSLAVLGAGATVGPYAYLRPGTYLGADGKIGTFVETKNVEIGAGAKIPHLTYAGDATIGEGTNIGASSVFVNYDGVNKHRTTIGRHCRTGSDTMFIAPVAVGDGAYTAAGTVVRKDVPAGALAVNVAPQRNLEGWVARRRPGTAAAMAAEAADAALAAPAGADAPPQEQDEPEGEAPGG